MMIFILIAGSYTPICLITLKRTYRTDSAFHCLGDRYCRNSDQGLLGLLPEMGIFHSLHRDGMDLRTGFHTNFPLIIAGGIWLAFSRGNHLHDRRYYLRIKASDLQ